MPSTRQAPTPIDPRTHPALTEALRELAGRGVVHHYRRGVTLIREGDRGEALFIVLAGSVRAFSVGDKQREVTYGKYGPGEYMGEMSLDGGPRSASVATLEPTVCAVVTRPTLEAFLVERPEFAFELLAKVIRRARALTLRTKQLALNDVYGRLRALLLELLPAGAEQGPIDDLPTHRELSQQLGCSRSMVTRLLTDLEKGGYVEVGRGRLTVLRLPPPKW